MIKIIARTYILFFLFAIYSNIKICNAQTSDSIFWGKKLNDVSDTARIRILNELSKKYRLTHIEKSLSYAQQAIVLSKELKNYPALTASYECMADAYSVQNNYDKAITFHLKALQISKKIGDKKEIGNILSDIGAEYHYSGNYQKATEWYLKGLKKSEEIDYKEGIGTCCNNLGGIYFHLKVLDKSLEYFHRALDIAQKTHNKRDMAYPLSNMGNVYFIQGDFKNALEYYRRALKMEEDIGNKKGIALNLNNLGSSYSHLGNYAKSLEFYVKCLKIQEEINDRDGKARSLGNIGISYYSMGDASEGAAYIQQALILAIEIKSKEMIAENYFKLSDIYVNEFNYQKAYEYFHLYTKTKDSIFTIESSKQIADMQTKYETEKKEKEIQLLQKDKEIQSQELNRQKLVRNAIGGGLLIVFIFALVLTNRFLFIKRQKKTIDKEREKSEKLLLNILPKDTAEELKVTGKAQPQSYEMATVMFTDFKGFTMLAEKMSAEELVTALDFVFKKFDEIISDYPIEKIKTIGDAYMCAGGLPLANTTNPMDVVNAALDIKKFMLEYKEKRIAEGKPYFEIRIGVHTGPVVAGVVGDKKFAYDVWGDTVNTASRMESSGEPGKVNISGSTYKNIQGIENLTGLNFTFRGKIPAKNKGEIEMYFVEKNIEILN